MASLSVNALAARMGQLALPRSAGAVSRTATFARPLTTSFSGTRLSHSLRGASFQFTPSPILRAPGRGQSLVVRAGGTSMACTKRSASRKKRARVSGFRERMKTTAGAAVLKRRRARGRAVLCTQTSSPTGKNCGRRAH